jgi:hypothetical protein
MKQQKGHQAKVRVLLEETSSQIKKKGRNFQRGYCACFLFLTSSTFVVMGEVDEGWLVGLACGLVDDGKIIV